MSSPNDHLGDTASILKHARDVLGFVMQEEELERGIPPNYVEDLTQTSIVDVEKILTSIRKAITNHQKARILAGKESFKCANAKIKAESKHCYADLNYGLGNQHYNVPNIIDIPEFFKAFNESQIQGGNEERDDMEDEAMEEQGGGSASGLGLNLKRKRSETYQPNLVQAMEENTEQVPIISGVQSLAPTPPPPPPLVCGLCQKISESKLGLQQHLTEVHPQIASKVLLDPLFRCGSCLQEFETSVGVTRHVKICTRNRPDKETEIKLSKKLLYCGLCKGNHAQVENTQECYHRHGHIRCVLCLFTVDSKSEWADHMLKFHKQDGIENPSKMFRCPFCDNAEAIRTRNCIEHMVEAHLSKYAKLTSSKSNRGRVAVRKSAPSQSQTSATKTTGAKLMTMSSGAPIPHVVYTRAPTPTGVTPTNKQLRTSLPTPSTTVNKIILKGPVQQQVEGGTSPIIMPTTAPTRYIVMTTAAQRNLVGSGTVPQPRPRAPVTGGTPRGLTTGANLRAPATGGIPRPYALRMSSTSAMVGSTTGRKTHSPSGTQQSHTVLTSLRPLLPKSCSLTPIPTPIVLASSTGTPVPVTFLQTALTGNAKITAPTTLSSLGRISSGNLRNPSTLATLAPQSGKPTPGDDDEDEGSSILGI